MSDKFYGNINQFESESNIDLYIEEINNNGFVIITDALNKDDLAEYRNKIDDIYSIQEKEFGLQRLESINEKDMCRMPLKYDDYFINIATNKTVLQIVEKLLGAFYILNLQNAT